MQFCWGWMRSDRPIIGVTGPDEGGTVAWWFTRFAVWLHGGKALRIRPMRTVDRERLDGLILGGGADINPKVYGMTLGEAFQRSQPSKLLPWWVRLLSFLFYPVIFLVRKLFSTKRTGIDQARDDLEFDLLEFAVSRDLPVLGICRGSQLINIYFGGNLHQDIAEFYTEIPRIHSVWPRKKVRLTEDSRLQRILQARVIYVNALHHQAVDTIGERLNVVGEEPAGLVQAIEHPEREYMIGVQWHPEYMPQIPLQRRLFRELVRCASASGSPDRTRERRVERVGG